MVGTARCAVWTPQRAILPCQRNGLGAADVRCRIASLFAYLPLRFFQLLSNLGFVVANIAQVTLENR